MIIEISYLIYLVISIAMAIWVARTLSKNGRVFLLESFGNNQALAKSVNHMLVLGFYLINLGYILLSLRTQDEINTVRASIEFLSYRIGIVLLVLGFMHFFNVFVITRWRASKVAEIEASASH